MSSNKPTYVHLRSRKGDCSITVCFLRVDEEDPEGKTGYTNMGAAFCHRTEDQFTRSEGRDLALKRAVEDPIKVSVPFSARLDDPSVFVVDGNLYQAQRPGSKWGIRKNSFLFWHALKALLDTMPVSDSFLASATPWLDAAPSWARTMVPTLLSRFESAEGATARRPYPHQRNTVVVPPKKKGFWATAWQLLGLGA